MTPGRQPGREEADEESEPATGVRRRTIRAIQLSTAADQAAIRSKETPGEEMLELPPAGPCVWQVPAAGGAEVLFPLR